LYTAVTPASLIKGRFTGLTIILVVVLLAVSVITDQRLRDLVVSATFSVMLLFAVWSVGPRLRIVTVVLAVPAFLGHWALQLSDSLVLRSVGFALSTIFLAFLTMVVLITVLRDPAVTADTIVGALCSYFLMGVTWGTAYSLLALQSVSAFAVSSTLAAASHWGPPTSPIAPLLQYYSFITLSSVGFGDISPLSGAARTLTAFEGVAGQLYLAVLIARLVGIHTAGGRRA
jgi:hypothetical protein